MIPELELERAVFKGSRRRVYVRFYDEDDNLADPDGFTLRLIDRHGGGDTFAYGDDGQELVKQSTGVYYKDYTFGASGKWKILVAATGNIQEVQPATLEVHPA